MKTFELGQRIQDLIYDITNAWHATLVGLLV